jgi:hypothetical protein
MAVEHAIGETLLQLMEATPDNVLTQLISCKSRNEMNSHLQSRLASARTGGQKWFGNGISASG